MKNRKKEKTLENGHPCTSAYVVCEMCGRKVKADACNWQEDDEGALYCVECRDELESCGCSD